MRCAAGARGVLRWPWKKNRTIFLFLLDIRFWRVYFREHQERTIVLQMERRTEGEGIMTTTKTPIVLIHGLWMTPKSWDTWAEYFEARGHQVIRPGWPGIDDREVADIRSNPEALKNIGLTQIADNYERIIKALPV